jgi:hypothetical protein
MRARLWRKRLSGYAWAVLLMLFILSLSMRTISAANPTLASLGPSVTRGIVRFTSTDFAAMHGAGFNAATDGGVQDNGAAEAAAGITGMVWVDAYDNKTCTQTLTNAAIQSLVQANVSAGQSGLRYMVGDEPTANGCNAAPAYRSMTQAVHAVDPTAKTWVIDDQFQVGNAVLPNIPMAGTVDILAFDIYPCQSGPCDFSAIDSAVHQIHAAGLTNWEFVIQDFSASSWRWPTPTEIQTQFAHWQNSGAIGSWVFAWDYLGGQVIGQPGNVAALQAINALPINGAGSSSPSTSSPLASPTAQTSAGSAGTTPAPAVASPAAASPTPAQPSTNPKPSTVSQPTSNTITSNSNKARNAALMATILGSILVSGLGGSVFVWWRRRRLL